jgi:hypothetical protein
MINDYNKCVILLKCHYINNYDIFTNIIFMRILKNFINERISFMKIAMLIINDALINFKNDLKI